MIADTGTQWLAALRQADRSLLLALQSAPEEVRTVLTATIDGLYRIIRAIDEGEL